MVTIKECTEHLFRKIDLFLNSKTCCKKDPILQEKLEIILGNFESTLAEQSDAVILSSKLDQINAILSVIAENPLYIERFEQQDIPIVTEIISSLTVLNKAIVNKIREIKSNEEEKDTDKKENRLPNLEKEKTLEEPVRLPNI